MPTARFSPEYKKTLNKDFEQKTTNKSINKTCNRRIKKRTKLYLLTVQYKCQCFFKKLKCLRSIGAYENACCRSENKSEMRYGWRQYVPKGWTPR